MPKAAVLMKTPAVGAQLWHKRTMEMEMEPELDLNQASRETLLAVIAEQRGVIAEQQDTIAQMGKRVEGLEARLSGGGPEAGMPGHKPAARRKKPAEQEKKRRKKRPLCSAITASRVSRLVCSRSNSGPIVLLCHNCAPAASIFQPGGGLRQIRLTNSEQLRFVVALDRGYICPWPTPRGQKAKDRQRRRCRRVLRQLPLPSTRYSSCRRTTFI